MDIEDNILSIPSFTLYPITTQDLKTCFQSRDYKILCSLNGPYFDKKVTQLKPYFNITISNAQQCHEGTYTPQQLIKLQRKLQQILSVMVVNNRYERMIFDINIEIIQTNQNNPLIFILSPLVNLLSYSSMIKCLEIYSVFSCSAAILRDDKLLWGCPLDEKRSDDKLMVLCSDQRDKKTIMCLYQGEYNFVHYEKLASGLQESNEQLCKFQLQKTLSVYQMFH